MKAFFTEKQTPWSELVVENAFKKGRCQIYLVQSIKLKQDVTTVACLCISCYPEESINSDVLRSRMITSGVMLSRARFWRWHRPHRCSERSPEHLQLCLLSPQSPREDALLWNWASRRGLPVANKMVCYLWMTRNITDELSHWRMCFP